MTTIKAYTDLEQSKKLAKILPLESADLWYAERYEGHVESNGKYVVAKEPYYYPSLTKASESNYSQDTINDIPCWSLAVLLSIIPKRIKDYNVFRIDIGDNNFSAWYDEIGFGVNNDLPNITMKEPIDVCYEMILKLHKLKML